MSLRKDIRDVRRESIHRHHRYKVPLPVVRMITPPEKNGKVKWVVKDGEEVEDEQDTKGYLEVNVNERGESNSGRG